MLSICHMQIMISAKRELTHIVTHTLFIVCLHLHYYLPALYITASAKINNPPRLFPHFQCRHIIRTG